MTFDELDHIYRDKYAFVKHLQKFYREMVGNPETIKRLDYFYDGMRERVFVTYDSYSQKYFDVSGDSFQGIMIDFSRFLHNPNKYDWIIPDSENYHKEFMEEDDYWG